MADRKFRLEQVSVRLVKDAPLLSETAIRTAEDAVRVLGDAFRDYDREVVGVVHLRSDNSPINMTIVSMGCLNQSLIHPRELLKAAFLSNAASILMFHNHPSGNVTPSRDDIAITGRMQQVCMLAGIPVIDHIILGGGQSYYSFREKKIMPMDGMQYSEELADLDLKVAEKKAREYGSGENGRKKSIRESLEEKKKITAADRPASRKKPVKEQVIREMKRIWQINCMRWYS